MIMITIVGIIVVKKSSTEKAHGHKTPKTENSHKHVTRQTKV